MNCYRDLVVVAGGIGLAPLRPVIYQVRSRRQDYRSLQIFYGARSPEEILYSSQLAEWEADSDTDLYVTVDHSTQRWQGNVGVVADGLDRFHGDPARALALVCGPVFRFADIAERFKVREL